MRSLNLLMPKFCRMMLPVRNHIISSHLLVKESNGPIILRRNLTTVYYEDSLRFRIGIKIFAKIGSQQLCLQRLYSLLLPALSFLAFARNKSQYIHIILDH